MLDREYNKLSGGDKTLINLASMILSNPDILLLDEPTNHLDIDTLEWFEEYLNNYKGAALIVSHDRYFLDRVVNKIIEIKNGKEDIYHGNYSYYIKESERRFLSQFAAYKNQQKAHLFFYFDTPHLIIRFFRILFASFQLQNLAYLGKSYTIYCGNLH